MRSARGEGTGPIAASEALARANGDVLRHLLFALAAALVSCRGADEKSALAAPPLLTNEVHLAREQADKLKIAAAAVDLEEVDDTVLVSGRIAYDDQRVAHVFSPVSGKLVSVRAQLGNRVKKNDVLAVIESPDIGVATSDVGKARADLIAAENDFQRQKKLLDTRAASPKDFEIAADNYRKAKAELARAELKAALFRNGDVVGQTYTLRSEIEGEVFMKAASPGMEVAGQYGGSNPLELFTVGDASAVWVLADVYELDVRRVKIGSKVIVSVASWPRREFVGSVDWISGALDPTTHATRVRATFRNEEAALRPEMFVSVRISVEARKALAIPRSAVLRFGDQNVVFLDRGVGADGKVSFERVPVRVDEGEGGSWLTVDHGLARGDRVVTSGGALLASML